MAKGRNELIFEVAGHPLPTLRIGYGRHMCGCITNGVSLANGDKAGYVLAFTDLEKAYLAAKEFGESHPISHEEKRFAAILEERALKEHTHQSVIA